jgi:ribonucleoside-triphosphate reductase
MRTTKGYVCDVCGELINRQRPVFFREKGIENQLCCHPECEGLIHGELPDGPLKEARARLASGGAESIRMKCQEAPEVYSRVVGFFRPVQQWNKGKKGEYGDRVNFKIE